MFPGRLTLGDLVCKIWKENSILGEGLCVSWYPFFFFFKNCLKEFLGIVPQRNIDFVAGEKELLAKS